LGWQLAYIDIFFWHHLLKDVAVKTSFSPLLVWHSLPTRFFTTQVKIIKITHIKMYQKISTTTIVLAISFTIKAQILQPINLLQTNLSFTKKTETNTV